MATNFFGNFVWWTGIVRNRVDPLGLGRAQVRIMGYHDGLEDSDLPWTHPMYPVNGSYSFSSPKVDDWVVGFFLDRENAQVPVMMGILPGLQNNTDNKSGN